MSDLPDWTTYALLSDVVYDRGLGNQSLKLPNQISLQTSFEHDSFYGAVYKSGSDYIVALRGTDNLGDFWTNFSYALGLEEITSQLKDTLDLVHIAQSMAGSTGRVLLTGHSLGGGLAALAGAYASLPAYVFDPAPFNKPDANVESFQDSPVFNTTGGSLADHFDQAVVTYVHTMLIDGEINSTIPFAKSFNSESSVNRYTGYIAGAGSLVETGSVDLHSMSLLSLIQTSLTTAHGGAPAFDAILQNDRVLREDLINGNGITGPLTTPKPNEGGQTQPDQGYVFRLLDNSLLTGDGQQYTNFYETFGDEIDHGGAKSGLSGSDLSDNSIHSGIVALGLQILRDAVKDSSKAGNQTNQTINNADLANNPLGDIAKTGAAIAHLSDIKPVDDRQKASDGLDFGVDDLDHVIWDRLNDALDGSDAKEAEILKASKDQVFGTPPTFDIAGDPIPQGQAQGLDWKVVVVQAGTDGAALSYKPSDQPRAGDTSSQTDDKLSHLIIGGDGDDTITGSSERDFILLGKGNDLVHASKGGDIIFGGGDDDADDGKDEVDTVDYGKPDSDTGPDRKAITLDLTKDKQKYLSDNIITVPGDAFDQSDKADTLIGIEVIKLTERADTLNVDRDGLKAKVTIDMGTSDRQGDLFRNVDVVDYSAVGQAITYDNGRVTLGNGKDSGGAPPPKPENLVVKNADKIILTSGDDVVESAGLGNIIETGDGHDTVWFSPNTAIGDLSFDDRITLAGSLTLYGGLRNKHSENPYAVSWGGLVEWGKNNAGDLIVRIPWLGSYGEDMSILNWNQQAKEQGTGGAQLGPGNIVLAEYEIGAYRLLDPNKPAGASLYSTWELFGYFTKIMTGTSSWGGKDPLVLDLDGDGIELTPESEASPLFDTDADLYKEETGWVRPDDGFLVRDLNGNGVIDDAREMFGATTAAGSGFADLATLDGNHDGKVDAGDDGLADFNGDGRIDASDTFATLKVWRDLDQDGKTEAGELFSLADLGIVSIGVAGAATNQTIAGNLVTAEGTFTRADGTTGTVADVSLSVDNEHSVYAGPPITTTGAAAAMLDPGTRLSRKLRRSARVKAVRYDRRHDAPVGSLPAWDLASGRLRKYGGFAPTSSFRAAPAATR